MRNWKVTKAATCTNDGREERTCANCGGKETRTITSPGHKWKDDYTVDKEATCTEEGSKSKHCSVCNTINKEYYFLNTGDRACIWQLEGDGTRDLHGEWESGEDLRKLWR